MAITTEQLEAMLAAATPGPWAMGPDEEGEPAQCITADGFDIATAWGGYNRADADTRLIAAAPEVTAELIAAHKRIAELDGALRALMELNDNHGPFGGEMYQDRIDSTWDRAHATLEPKP